MNIVRPPVAIDMGDLRRVEPVGRKFGFDRGTPIDRFYIESFLRSHTADIRGRVLEVGESTYTRRFGLTVDQSDVLHAVAGNRHATMVGDLQSGVGISHDAFDCVILTQVLPFLFDVRAAIATVRRALKPAGTVLATVPCISQISRYDMDRWGDFWRFTPLSVRKLFELSFAPADVQIESHGNALAATAFIQGMAQEELTREELEAADADYPLIVTIRAHRPFN